MSLGKRGKVRGAYDGRLRWQVTPFEAARRAAGELMGASNRAECGAEPSFPHSARVATPQEAPAWTRP